jgi:hypothetical protein
MKKNYFKRKGEKKYKDQFSIHQMLNNKITINKF